VKAVRAVACFVCCVVLAVLAGVPAVRAQRASAAESESHTGAAQKISAPLLKEIYRRRGDGRRVQPGASGVHVDRHGRTLVDVRAALNDPLKRKIAALGGRVVATSSNDQTVVALMPVTMIERLAEDGSVRAITVNSAAH